jgi:hypothetical protein
VAAVPLLNCAAPLFFIFLCLCYTLLFFRIAIFNLNIFSATLISFYLFVKYYKSLKFSMKYCTYYNELYKLNHVNNICIVDTMLQ